LNFFHPVEKNVQRRRSVRTVGEDGRRGRSARTVGEDLRREEKLDEREGRRQREGVGECEGSHGSS
jgi:hypothetical protein